MRSGESPSICGQLSCFDQKCLISGVFLFLHHLRLGFL